MSNNGGKIIYKDLSYKVVGVLFDVYNDIGYGYKEKYYEKAVAKCFDERGIKYQEQIMYKIKFKDEILGNQFLDFLVEDKIILEIKQGNYTISK